MDEASALSGIGVRSKRLRFWKRGLANGRREHTNSGDGEVHLADGSQKRGSGQLVDVGNLQEALRMRRRSLTER